MDKSTVYTELLPLNPPVLTRQYAECVESGDYNTTCYVRYARRKESSSDDYQNKKMLLVKFVDKYIDLDNHFDSDDLIMEKLYHLPKENKDRDLIRECIWTIFFRKPTRECTMDCVIDYKHHEQRCITHGESHEGHGDLKDYIFCYYK